MFDQITKDNLIHIIKNDINNHIINNNKDSGMYKITYNGERCQFGNKTLWASKGSAKRAIRNSLDYIINYKLYVWKDMTEYFVPNNEKIEDYDAKDYLNKMVWEYIYTELFKIEEIQ